MAFLTVNSQFTPYTFDELVKPYVMYDAAYQENQARTDALLEKAAQLEDLSPTVDKETYDSYQEWKSQLKAVSDELATSGLNNNTRRAINTLSNRYSTDYLPTVAKLKARGELIKEQREYLQKHPNAFFDVDYSTTPVDKVSSSSTFNTYDLDEISKSVATDSYSRLASGQKSLTPDEYMSMYGSGITDKTRQAQVANAISSGMALASANHQQKELENYLNQVRTMRTGRSSSGGGYAAPRSTTSGGSFTVGKGGYVNLPDGTAVKISYDKNSGTYTYTDMNKKTRTADVTNGQINSDAVIVGYYGGEYEKLNVGNIRTAMISDDEGSAIIDSKGKMVQLPDNPNNKDLYEAYYGKEIFPINEASLSYRNSDYDDDRGRKKFKKKLDNGDIRMQEIDVDNYKEYGQSDRLQQLSAEISNLKSLGILSRDSKVVAYYEGNALAGYEVYPEYLVNLIEPISKKKVEVKKPPVQQGEEEDPWG